MKKKEVRLKIENLANEFVKIFRKNSRDINLLGIELKFNDILFSVDIDSRVINTAQVNARNAGVQKFIEFSCKDIIT